MRDILFVIAYTGILAAAGSFWLHFLRRGIGSFQAGTFCAIIAYFALTADLLTGLFSAEGTDYMHVTCWLILTCYFGAVYKLKNRLIGTFLTPIIALLMSVAALSDGMIASQAVKDSFFTWTHLLLLLGSFALFFICFTSSLLYILKVRAIKDHRSLALDRSLPPLEKLSAFTEKTFNISWIMMTAGILLAFIAYFTGSSRNGGEMQIKIIWGTALWLMQTICFILYNSRRIHARGLARSICFISLGSLCFLLYISLSNTGKSAQEAPAATTTVTDRP